MKKHRLTEAAPERCCVHQSERRPSGRLSYDQSISHPRFSV